MTIKQYARIFLVAALLGAAFAVLPTKADHGELFGISAALAAHTGGGNGRNGGMNAGEASHGVDPDRSRDQRTCDLTICR